MINEASLEIMYILMKRPDGCSLSQTYMNLTPVFLHHNLPKPCFILSDWSLEIMLKALYIQERGIMFPPYDLPIEDLFDLTRIDRMLISTL